MVFRSLFTPSVRAFTARLLPFDICGGFAFFIANDLSLICGLGHDGGKVRVQAFQLSSFPAFQRFPVFLAGTFLVKVERSVYTRVEL